jgi:hypothetical protein
MKVWSFVVAVLPLALFTTQALAENWVTTPASPLGLTSTYDADSVYVEASTGLIYATTCDEKPCIAAKDDYNISLSRYDCDRATVSYYRVNEWSTPATRASNEYDMSENTYKDGTTSSEILEAVCAQRSSWPRR